MKETRVNKYQQYRNTIAKEDRKSFFAPNKSEEVSTEMGLFLKLKKRQRIENIAILSICLIIILLLIIFGIKLF